jgi:hypothetical protein
LIKKGTCSSGANRIGSKVEKLAVFVDLDEGYAARTKVQDVTEAAPKMITASNHALYLVNGLSRIRTNEAGE